MARQLAFDLPAEVRLEARDFFVGPANEQAYAMVLSPESWPNGKLALVGPARSGKTHLARIFADATDAAMVRAGAIDPDADLPDTALVVEDGPDLQPHAEEWLFHAHNRLAQHGLPLLVTGRSAPARWPLTLPDLASRLSAATSVTIDQPDDALLTALLLKQFQDRQLTPAPDALTYLVRNLPRSFAAVQQAVETLDRRALAQSRSLTRPFVQTVLAELDPDGRS